MKKNYYSSLQYEVKRRTKIEFEYPEKKKSCPLSGVLMLTNEPSPLQEEVVKVFKKERPEVKTVVCDFDKVTVWAIFDGYNVGKVLGDTLPF